MLLKNTSAAGTKMAVRGGVLEVDENGEVEVADKDLARIMIGQGWSAVKASPKVAKVEEPKVEEPKVEEPKAEEPKAKAEEPKKKFKRSVSSGRRSKKS